MAEHRQSPDPILPQPNFSIAPDGTVTIDSKDYEEMLAFCMDELGQTHFFFPRVGGAWYTNCYWLWHNPMVLKERWYGAQILDEQLAPTAKFQAAFGSYVKQMMARFEAKGWADRVYMTTMDEPHKVEDMTAVRNVADFVHSVAPKVRRFCTTYPRPGLLGAIDAWCPQQYDEELVKQRQANGEQLMFYKNWLHLIDMPMVNPRLQGWIAWKIRAVGWLTYATMGRWDRAWDEPYVTYANHGIRAWGLGLFWYPDLLRPRILKSVRWEMMREGAEDYEYLALLAKRLKSIPDAQRQTHAAKAAQAFLETAANQVVLCPGVFPCGRKDEWLDKPNYTQSNRVPWELRNAAAHHIAALAQEP